MITWESLLKIESDIKRLQKNIERFESIARDEVEETEYKIKLGEKILLNLENLESTILEGLSLEYLPSFDTIAAYSKPLGKHYISENRIDHFYDIINGRIEGVLKHFESLKTLSLENLSAEVTKSKKITVEQINNFLYSLEDKREPTSLEVEMISRLKLLSDRRKDIPIKKQIKEKPAPITTLLEAFDSPSKYQKIMQLMVDKEFIQSGTYIWKDEKNSNLQTIVHFLKVLHLQNYYTDKRRLKTEEIKLIIKNTFGRDISISSIKQHKLSEKDKAFNFIPIASTLQNLY